MQRTINFVTPTQLSFIDLITMGDSSKRDDNKTIGQFGSGLKYAIALLLRNNVQFNVFIKGEAHLGGENRWYTENYSPYIYTQFDELTEKSKDLIGFKVEREYESFHSQFVEDCFSAPEQSENLETGFALQLGYNWELWMALREIYSNMLDENGYFTEEEVDKKNYGTIISLTFEEDSLFSDVWNKRNNFIHEGDWEWDLFGGVQVCRNTDTWLKIYKNNILIYENKDTNSYFSYQHNSAKIDERRLINDRYSSFSTIAYSILSCKDRSLIDLLLGEGRKICELLERQSSVSVYNTLSQEWMDAVDEVVSFNGEFTTAIYIEKRIKEDGRYSHSGRVIESLSSQLFSYSRPVTVEEIPKPVQLSKKEEILERFSIDLEGIEIKESKLTGRSCVADKRNKTIIISPLFNLDADMAEFVVECFSLREGNVLENISKELVKLLTKR